MSRADKVRGTLTQLPFVRYNVLVQGDPPQGRKTAMINSGRAAAGPWANHRQATSPVSWNHENKRFDVMLSGFTMKEASPDDRIEVTFAPPVLYVHSI